MKHSISCLIWHIGKFKFLPPTNDISQYPWKLTFNPCGLIQYVPFIVKSPLSLMSLQDWPGKMAEEPFFP